MLKCLECGHEFEWGEEASWRENHGNGIYEPWTGCPVCYGAFEEVSEIERKPNDEEGSDCMEFIGRYVCQTCGSASFSKTAFSYDGLNIRDLYNVPFSTTKICQVCFEKHPCDIGIARLTNILAVSASADKDID